MRKVLLLGAGKIGRMIAKFLSSCGDYDVLVGDDEPAALARIRDQSKVETVEVDAADPGQLPRHSAGASRHLRAQLSRTIRSWPKPPWTRGPATSI